MHTTPGSPTHRWYTNFSFHPQGFRALLLLVALVFPVGCSSESRTQSPGGQLPVLVPVPQPDFHGMEPSVQEQLLTAQSQLQEVLASIDPDTAELSHLFGKQGQLYLAYELEQAARACFTNAWRLASHDFRWTYYLGYLLHKEGRPEESRTHYQRALELNPDYLAAYIGLAESLIEANQPDEAEQFLNKALGLDPSCAPALIGLGQIASSRKQHGKAVEHFETARRLAPRATRINFPLGMAYRALGDRERARHFLTRRGSGEARLSDPLLDELSDLATGSRAFNQRGDYATLQGHYQAALGFYQQAVDAAPENSEYHVDLAAALIQLNDLNAAVEQLQEALRLDPGNGVANYNWAIILTRQGRDQDAVAYHEKALASNPDHKEARFNMASAFLRLHRFDEAAMHFERVVDIDPLNGAARFGQAVALMHLKRWAEAKSLLEDSFAARPDDAHIANVFARLLAACPLDELRDGHRALEIARQLVTSDRSLHNVEALAMALAELGRFEEAARLQEEALAAIRQAGQHDQEVHLTASLTRYRQRQPARSPLGK